MEDCSFKNNYVVAIRCFTYNHASFIEDALNGFAMQETSFPAVYIIVDDASTDGEPEVIREWALGNLEHEEGEKLWKEMPFGQLAVAPLKDKSLSTFVILLLSENHYQTGKSLKRFDYISEWYDNVKYQALCEGDDYWINPQKLQMQVDFMETHPEYVMCHTDFNRSDGKYRNHEVYTNPDDDYFRVNVRHGIEVGTLTSLYRTDTYNKIPKCWTKNHWPMGDYPMWIEMSHEGKLKYLPIVTACYRVLNNSASHGTFEKEIKFFQAAAEVRRYYGQYYNVELPNNGYTKGYFLSIIKIAFKHQRPKEARAFYNQAKECNMLNNKMRLLYFATCFKPLGWLLRRVYSA